MNMKKVLSLLIYEGKRKGKGTNTLISLCGALLNCCTASEVFCVIGVACVRAYAASKWRTDSIDSRTQIARGLGCACDNVCMEYLYDAVESVPMTLSIFHWNSRYSY